ncbi:MAG: ArsB/NhaD family transporter [Candidatus Competibacteraceae bacterium]|nr:ArsB/NhaD family transporter [Candidatus Competibacteraceae bacterium]MBK8895837.1 ArsB/NhaD family transporter [Candidatus Competibacteraceae bacterium]MBK8962929.1 ArsB/NhaD family transporter [Candidatus Competibacteraceae bacterium]MBK9953137.1 ArsB/NhaD family transporter [Candidatus Competibacteraceae bacterium]
MHGSEGVASTGYMWVAAILFVITYGVVMSEKVNRAIVALVAAGLMIILGVINQEQAIRGIDFNTIGLLIGMMLIVAITRQSGIFQYMAIWSAKKVNANPWGILVMISLVTAVTSAFLDNVTTVLLVVPVTLLITEELKVNPYPYLFSMIFSSNIGGTATLIGDPPNIMIGSATGLTFNDFAWNLAPVIIVVQIATLIPIYFIWGRQLRANAEDRQRVMQFNEFEAIKDWRLLKQCLSVIGLVVFGFIFAKWLHLEAATIAIFGAAVLLLLANFGRDPEHQSKHVLDAFNEVEWITIFFFVGLFIVVHGVDSTGLLKVLAEKMLALTGGNLNATAMVILWSSAVLSAIIDNIPFVATMIPLIKAMAPTFGGPEGLMPLWWALSLGACLGGNGTLIGASANLVVAGFAERAGQPIRFMRYTMVAFPIMLMSIFICMYYLEWRYL